MSLDAFKDRLQNLGCAVSISGDVINIDSGDLKISVTVSQEWKDVIDSFYKENGYRFNSDKRILISERTAEFQLTRLDPGYFFQTDYKFKDKQGNIVLISSATKEFLLSYFESERYATMFERVKERLFRSCEVRKSKRDPDKRVEFRRIEDLMFKFHTGQYISIHKLLDNTIENFALDNIRSCLFSLAQSKGECWEISHDIKSRGVVLPQFMEEVPEVMAIPNARYESSLVSYYKVAKSSRFPSQVFLSYYHILEYYFLRVADETLFSAVRSKLNDPGFFVDYESVSGLVATIKRNDSTADEKRMLRDVLDKYVPEEDFIEFLKSLESDAGEKLYTGSKQIIFGESLSIKLEKGHALSNVAALLKHIRNALVHSSDRYSRDDCFLPFTESEEIIVKYIPLVQFLAEKVIFSTAR